MYFKWIVSNYRLSHVKRAICLKDDQRAVIDVIANEKIPRGGDCAFDQNGGIAIEGHITRSKRIRPSEDHRPLIDDRAAAVAVAPAQS